MGPRRPKLLYRDGLLRDVASGAVLRRWESHSERIEPHEHRVTLETDSGVVRIHEDESGLRVSEDGNCQEYGTSGVCLPRFKGHPHATWLRALHAEILVNLMPFGPVPNLHAYPRPWYRDSAMMLMVLEKTGNLGLVEPWIAGLHQVYDNNNAGECEADNLGQLLYIVSLIDGGAKHPIVERVLKASRQYEVGGPKDRHLLGRTDFAERPVYQTKWMKFGLRALGLDDPYEIPAIEDKYSSLFWWDYKDQHIGERCFEGDVGVNYPYLTWAEAHFYGDAPPMHLLGAKTPLTWEAQASQAEYWRMREIASELETERIAAPHTWHAAEAFLYLLELD